MLSGARLLKWGQVAENHSVMVTENDPPAHREELTFFFRRPTDAQHSLAGIIHFHAAPCGTLWHPVLDLFSPCLAPVEVAGRLGAREGKIREAQQRILNDIACLKFKTGDEQALPCVLDVPLQNNTEMSTVTLSSVPPLRFQFLDCRAYVRRAAVRILEFETLPEGRYNAISYVWKGVSADASGSPGNYMAVKGAEHADPISLSVLRAACIMSLSLYCEILWLDRLGIMQGPRADMSWQIKNMCRIYQSCKSRMRIESHGVKIGKQQIDIFSKSGSSDGPHVKALMAALGSRRTPPGPESAGAIWRAAMMRTSTRPIDMIFSIMGILGVELDTLAYTKDDRQRATIHLARAVLAKSEPASFLGLSLRLEPNPKMSTMPIIPETSVDGKAYVQTRNGREEIERLVGGGWWYLADAPTGSMDEPGYFSFNLKAAPVRSIRKYTESSESAERLLSEKQKQYRLQAPEQPVIISENGREEWLVLSDAEAVQKSSSDCDDDAGIGLFAVVIGRHRYCSDGLKGRAVNPYDRVLAIVAQHAIRR
ncbi:hypothetical protein V8F33_009543 [Rhypophila sp. PSN 637]